MSQPSFFTPRRTVLSGLAVGLICASGSQAGLEIHVPSQQPTIQAGINAAANGDQVVLADGTYTGAGNVNCTFGGKLITVRSASGNPQACTIDCQSAANTRGFTFNTGETSAAVLNGITIQAGNFTDPGGSAGAILLTNTSPTITNCRFMSNRARLGGTVFSNSAASPTFTDCLFYDNHTTVGNGGAVFLQTEGTSISNPAFTNCAFVNNESSANGGAVYTATVVSPTFRSCRFIANTANGGGGAIFSAGTSAAATLLAVNSLFETNVAGNKGGAVRSESSGPLQFVNCTFSRNTANDASGGGACWIQGLAVITLKNCIAWHDAPNELGGPAAQYVATFCSIENGPFGTGSLTTDPLFANPHGADSIPGTLDDDYSLLAGSPCIDSADNAPVQEAGLTVDLNGNPRFVDDPATLDTGWGRAPLVDRGCFEVQPGAAPECLADLNGDGHVNGVDLGILLASWSIPADAPGCGQ